MEFKFTLETITFGAVLWPWVIQYIALIKYVKNVIPEASSANNNDTGKIRSLNHYIHKNALRMEMVRGDSIGIRVIINSCKFNSRTGRGDFIGAQIG